MHPVRELASQAAWRIWPQTGIGLEDIRLVNGKGVAASDGSKVRLMALFRVCVPDVAEDPKGDYSAALKTTLQQQRMRGLFEGLRRASVPFVYVMLMSETEARDPAAPVLEFDLVVGTWVDIKKKEDGLQALEQRAGILSATLSVALPTATVVRLVRGELSEFVKSVLLPGRRSLPQAGPPAVTGALCTFDEMSPIAASLEQAPEFYVPNASEAGADGILLGAVRSGGREFHDFRLQMDDLRRHVSVLGMSIDNSEPIIYRRKGRINVDCIGNLIDPYFEAGEEGRRFPPDLECVSFDPETGSLSWSPIQYVLRHRYTGKMLRLRLETGRSVTVTPNHSVFSIVDGRIGRVDARQLGVGDYVVAPSMIPANSGSPQTIDLINLMKAEDGIFLYNVPPEAFDRINIKGRRTLKHDRRLPIKYASILTPHEISTVKIGYKGPRMKLDPIFVVDKDIARLFGYHTAEGSSTLRHEKSEYKISLTFGPGDGPLIQDCKRILLAKFGLSLQAKPHGKTSLRLAFNHRILATLFESFVGRGAANKQVPSFIFDSPSSVRVSFIKSWVAGDSGVTVSRKLINGIEYALLLEGSLSTVSFWEPRPETRIEGRNVSSLPAYQLKFPRPEAFLLDSRFQRRGGGREPYFPAAQIPNPLIGVCKGIRRKRISSELLASIGSRLERLEGYVGRGEIDAKHDGFYRTYSGTFLRRYRKRLVAASNLKEARREFEALRVVASASLSFLRVVGIEDVNATSDFVYDVSVPVNENFLAGFGGVFCHNTGSGKSTTSASIVSQVAEAGLPTLVLDWHNEYGAVVAQAGGKVVAPGKDDFSINPLEVGPGTDPVEHVAMVSDIFSDIYHFTHPQAYMFRNALQKRLGETSADEVPSIGALVRTIEAYPLRSAYDNETKVALLRRLVPLTQGQSGKALGGSGPLKLGEMLGTLVCVELGHMRDVQSRAVFSDVLLKMIYEEKVKRKGALDHLTVVEEARNVAPARRPEDPPTVGERMISELRKFGEAMLFVAQFPSHLAAEIVKNSGTKIVHRLAWPDDVALVGDSMGLNQKQREHLTRLKVGEAVVGLSRIQKPILVQVRPDYDSTAERRDLSFAPVA